MGLRLFTAITAPDAIRANLDRFLEPRRLADDGLRWTPPHRWHLTTSFIADAPATAVPNLTEALTEVATRFEPFPITLAGALAFPNPAAAKLLAQAVLDPTGQMAALAQASRTAAARVGLRPDNSRYQPHLTLARTNRRTNLTRWLEIIATIEPVTITVPDFVLVESHPPDYRHEVIERFCLNCLVWPSDVGQRPSPNLVT